MPAPVITSPLVARGSVGTFFTYAITATNTPTGYNAFRRFDELPPGLAINRTTGVISGTPYGQSSTDNYVQIYATNAAGTTKAELLMVIAAAPGGPVITSAATASGTASSAFSYQITATGATRYTATNLPSGLVLNTQTGAITGTHGLPGSFLVTLKAFNVANQFDFLFCTFIFSDPAGITPVITSPLYFVADKGQPFDYQITATGSPTRFSAVAFPSLIPDPGPVALGEFKGIPDVAQVYTTTLLAFNDAIPPPNFGSSIATFVIKGAVPGPPSDTIKAAGVPTPGISALLPTNSDIPTSILNNPLVDMVTLQMSWATIETSPLAYNFSPFTTRIAAAATAGKRVLIRLMTAGGAATLGGNVPNHVFTAMGVNPAVHTITPGVTYTYDVTGGQVTLPVFWHPTFVSYKRAFYRAYRVYHNSLPLASQEAILVEVVSIAPGTAGNSSEILHLPHGTAIVNTGGPSGTGYALSEVNRWLNATDAAQPGAGYTTAKMIAMATNIVSPTYTGAIMVSANSIYHATANFTNFDIGRPVSGAGGGIPAGAIITGITNPTQADINLNATILSVPFTLTIVGRDDGLIPTMLAGIGGGLAAAGGLDRVAMMEIAPMGALLDAGSAFASGEEPSNYLTRRILSIATINGAQFILGGSVSTQIPKEPDAGTTEWDVLDELPPNLVSIAGRNLSSAWGDTIETGGTKYVLNGGTADDPDGLVPTPPGLNASTILRKAAERFSTYRGTFLEVWLADLLNQSANDITYIRNLVKGGAIAQSPPVITSPTTITGDSGTALDYQITATGSPSLFTLAPDSSPGYDIILFYYSTGAATISLLSPGSYPLTMTAKGTSGMDTKTLTLIVGPPVSGNIPPVAAFTYSNSGLTVGFTDRSTDKDGSIVAWNWSFGDGLTSNAQNPSHVYSAAGTYSVVLGATDNKGATAFRIVSIVVSNIVRLPPVAQFTYVTTQLSVVFTDTSTDVSGTIIGWSWLFGDGGVSALRSPSHAYGTPGTYAVTLMVNDNVGGTATQNHTVVVTDPGAPVAAFDYELNDLTLTFFNLSFDPDGGPVTSHWMFGDGNSSDASDPVHTYATVGSYVVLLVVKDGTNKTGSLSQTIAVGIGTAGDQNVLPSAPLDASLRSNLKAVCKLRWVPKEPGDLMIIRNLDALRLMADAIINEQNGEWDKAAKAQMRAEQILEAELKEYLSGIQHTVPFTSDDTFGMGDIGDVL